MALFDVEEPTFLGERREYAAEVGDVLFDGAREDDEVVKVWCATWAYGCAVGVDGHRFIEADGAGVEEAVLYKGGLEFVGEVNLTRHKRL